MCYSGAGPGVGFAGSSSASGRGQHGQARPLCAALRYVERERKGEQPEFIDWALDGEGREQGYGCYVLDSWAMYFGRKHRETLLAVRERTGDPTAQPSADELAADQMVLQEVLRRLCVDSGACVVIV